MKKILAIALALMLFCLPMALADATDNSAAVMGLSNIKVMGMDLGELQLWAGIDTKDAIRMSFEAVVGEDSLLTGIAEMDGARLKVKFNDEDKAYSVDLSKAGDAVNQLPDLLRQLIPALDGLELPPVPAVTLPKLDTRSLLSAFSSDGQSFSIPSEMVDSLIDMASQYAGMITSSVPQVKSVISMLPQLKGQIAFDGTVADDGDAQVTRVNLLVGGNAAATLVFTTRENNARLALETEGLEQVGLNLATDAASDTIDLTVEALGSEVGSVNLYKKDGLQKVDLTVTAGDTVGMGFAYGEADGADVVDLDLNAGESGSMALELKTAKDAEGTRTGTLDFVSDFDHNEMDLSADVTMYLTNIEIGEISWPDTLLPIDQLDVNALLAPVGEYLGTLQNAA